MKLIVLRSINLEIIWSLPLRKAQSLAIYGNFPFVWFLAHGHIQSRFYWHFVSLSQAVASLKKVCWSSYLSQKLWTSTIGIFLAHAVVSKAVLETAVLVSMQPTGRVEVLSNGNTPGDTDCMAAKEIGDVYLGYSCHTTAKNLWKIKMSLSNHDMVGVVASVRRLLLDVKD